MTTIPTISTDDLASFCADPEHAVIDARPVAAYNGWRLAGEPRGGHVPEARSVPREWTRYMDWTEALEEKGIRPKNPVTVYAYSENRARTMTDRLSRLGFDELRVYGKFAEGWSRDRGRPLRRLHRHRRLVHPEWLRNLIDGNDPRKEPAGRWVLCHAHFAHPADYASGHIPDAVPLNTSWLESSDVWNRRRPETVRQVLTGLGIRSSTTVVLYGRYSYPTYQQKWPGRSAGHLAAMRCALIMLWAGVRDVRVLDGGIRSWEDAGYELSTGGTRPASVREFGAEVPARSEYVIDLLGARHLLSEDGAELVSVRSRNEYLGRRSGYHYITKKGRIPGAVFGNSGSDAYHMDNYRNFDYTCREAGQIADRWAEAGLQPSREIGYYCGTGWRASEAFWNAYLMGWENISVYDGGWYEWSQRPDLPTEAGPLR